LRRKIESEVARSFKKKKCPQQVSAFALVHL
jgi:hypothetical protein